MVSINENIYSYLIAPFVSPNISEVVREAAKKVPTLVVRPLKPYPLINGLTPPPLELSGNRNFLFLF